MSNEKYHQDRSSYPPNERIADALELIASTLNEILVLLQQRAK